MYQNDSSTTHGRQLLRSAHRAECGFTFVQTPLAVPTVLGVQQAKMLSEDILLDAPTSEEPHVTPELSASQRLRDRFSERLNNPGQGRLPVVRFRLIRFLGRRDTSRKDDHKNTTRDMHVGSQLEQRRSTESAVLIVQKIYRFHQTR